MKRLLASLAVAVGAAFLPGGPAEAADFRVAAAPGQTPIGSMSSPQADAMAGLFQSALEHLTYGVVQTAETGEQVVVGAYQVGGEFLGSALLFGEDALQTVGLLAADGADDLRRMGGDGLVASWVETGADTPTPDAATIPQADVDRGTPVRGRIEARPTPETAPGVIPASLVAATPASEAPTDLCSWPAPDADDPAALTGAHVTTLSRLGLMDESAQRLPDGTVFLPKVTQRLLQVRTSISCQGQIAASRRLVGHVIANPTSSGLVQAELDGRIDVGEFGFPVIGQRVEQGELLGYLVPTLSALEKAELEAEIAVLRGEVAEQELMIARSRELPLLPFREGRILSMRIELSKLRARRDALIAGLSARQPLVAPVSGVVARSEVRAGQVVEAREVLWEIADIDDLWVEADAFATNSRVAQTGSTAETQDGDVMALALQGQGLSTKAGQSSPIHFRLLDAPPTVRIGEQVMVNVRETSRNVGVMVPKSALVRRTNGEMVVWVVIGPEQYKPQRVKWRSVSPGVAEIESGLSDRTRVVVAGANLLSEIR